MNQLAQIEEFACVVDSLTSIDSKIDSRDQPRRRRSISLQIQPLDHDFQNDGDPFRAISRDVSRLGMAFINLESVDHDYLRVGLLDHDISVIGQVRHCTFVGDHYPLYLVGLEFVFSDV